MYLWICKQNLVYWEWDTKVWGICHVRFLDIATFRHLEGQASSNPLAFFFFFSFFSAFFFRTRLIYSSFPPVPTHLHTCWWKGWNPKSTLHALGVGAVRRCRGGAHVVSSLWLSCGTPLYLCDQSREEKATLVNASPEVILLWANTE